MMPSSRTIPNHVTPSRVPEELARVYKDAVRRWGVEDTLLIGDFNADCSYLTASELAAPALVTDAATFM